MKAVLHNIDDVRTFCSKLYQQELPVRVAIAEGKDRSLDQNNLAHKWFTEVGQQMGETMPEVKDRAKLDIGCTILRRDDPTFAGFFAKCLAPLTREQQLKSMKYLPVTSTLTVKQMTEFMETFEREHRDAGLTLTSPEDRK